MTRSEATAIELGADTGAGFVNQSTGSVTTASLTINSSGTGDLSQYNLLGGTVAAGSVVVNNAGELNVTGGTLTLDQMEALVSRTVLDVDGQLNVVGGSLTLDLNNAANPGMTTWLKGDGAIHVSTGSVEFVNGTAYNVVQLEVPMVVSGGSLDLAGQIRPRSEFNVIGSAASVEMARIGANVTSSFIFELDANGVSTINSTGGYQSLATATLLVDGSNYSGGATNINLFKSSNLHSQLAESDITVTNFSQGLSAVVTQDPGAGKEYVRLEISENETPFESWAGVYGLTGDNALPGTDMEPDGLDNLLEYALGGNPNSNDYASIAPSDFLAADGGTNWLYYVHNQRTDDPALTYTLGTATNLTVSNGWNTNDMAVVGASAEWGGIKTVTNRTSTSEDAKFIDLTVEKNP